MKKSAKKKTGAHWSDCATNNAPAEPVGECDCGGDAPLAVGADAAFNILCNALGVHERADVQSRLNATLKVIEERGAIQRELINLQDRVMQARKNNVLWGDTALETVERMDAELMNNDRVIAAFERGTEAIAEVLRIDFMFCRTPEGIAKAVAACRDITFRADALSRLAKAGV